MTFISSFIDKTRTKRVAVFYMVVLITICSLITGCYNNKNKTQIGEYQKPLEDESAEMELFDISSKTVVTKNKHFKIYRGSGLENRWYYYELIDTTGNIVTSQCTYMKEPNISYITEEIVKVSVQSGTGRKSQSVYYFNTEDKLISPTFEYVLNENANVVVYFDGEKLIACNMFNRNNYYKEIILKEQLSDVEEPINNVIFSNDDRQIVIEYVAGLDCREVSEVATL